MCIVFVKLPPKLEDFEFLESESAKSVFIKICKEAFNQTSSFLGLKLSSKYHMVLFYHRLLMFS